MQQPAVGDLFTPEQALANLELLKQELSGLEEGAALYFQGFHVPPNARNSKAQWRAWLLPTETLDDLKPEQTDYVLRNLEWFKAQIVKKQELLDDPLPWL